MEKLIKIADHTDEKLSLIRHLLSKYHLPQGYITRYENHSDLWIYVNKHIHNWLIKNIVPHMTLKHKIDNIMAQVAQVEGTREARLL